MLLWSFSHAFNMRGDSSFYADQNAQQETLRISARGKNDEAGYDVWDVPLARKIGAFQKGGYFDNLAQENWTLQDPGDNSIGSLVQGSAAVAGAAPSTGVLGALGAVPILGDLFSPQIYFVSLGQDVVSHWSHQWHPKTPWTGIHFSGARKGEFDPRLILAMALQFDVDRLENRNTL